MASVFDTALAARNAAMLERFGESITYTPSGGDAATITAVVDRDEVLAEELERESQIVYRMQIHVQTSDVATRTLERDTATIDGQTWVLDSEGPIGAGMVTLVVKRETTSEKRGQGHRASR